MNISNNTIVVVDDSALSRRFVTVPLRGAGYEVVEATNGVEGLAAIAEHKPLVVVTDLLMPEMDGFEMLSQIRKEDQDLPVIVVSADIQQSSREICERQEVAGFLNKPFRSEELLGLIDSLTPSFAP